MSLERETWYKDRENNDDDNESDTSTSKFIPGLKYRRGDTRRIPQRSLSRKKEQGDNKIQVTSVIFVPHTRGSSLAKQLRESEEKLYSATKTRVKIVERAGVKLQEMLTQSDPWKGKDCERDGCLLCNTKILTEKYQTQECTKRNIVYETWCITCEKAAMAQLLKECKDEKEYAMKSKEQIRAC